MDDSGLKVGAVVSEYIAKKICKKIKYSDCKNMLVSSESLVTAAVYNYLIKLSRGGLTAPLFDLLQYVAKSFAILDATLKVIRKSALWETVAAKYALN